MQYSSKKQSWIEFINESRGNNIKNEIIDRNMNEIQSNHINYANLHHHSVRIPSLEISNNKQQQNKFTNRKFVFTSSLYNIYRARNTMTSLKYTYTRAFNEYK